MCEQHVSPPGKRQQGPQADIPAQRKLSSHALDAAVGQYPRDYRHTVIGQLATTGGELVAKRCNLRDRAC
jgi:hypothetical protein